MKMKFEHYYLPAFVLLAIATPAAIRETLESRNAMIERGLILLALFLPPILLSTPIPLGAEKFPQLKAWMPFIQAHGDCHDRILFVDGGTPYGSSRDYAAILQFYTNRSLIAGVSCRNLETALTDSKITWVILSEESEKGCWRSPWKKRFPDQLRYGNLLLYSHYPLMEKDGGIDLAPLENQLRSVRDCETLPLHSGRFFINSSRSGSGTLRDN